MNKKSAVFPVFISTTPNTTFIFTARRKKIK